MTKNKLSHSQVVQVYARLNQVLIKTDDGLCRYAEGDDATYAKELGVTVSNIQGVRTQMFGKLHERRVPKSRGQSSIEQRLDNLERRLDKLISDLGGASAPAKSSGAYTNGARGALV
jgi:hypothetical protein